MSHYRLPTPSQAAIEALKGAPRDATPVIHTDSRYTMGIKDWLVGASARGSFWEDLIDTSSD